MLRLCAVFTLLACAALVFGCGKKGNPEPRDSSKAFSWEYVEAAMAGKCLAFSGKLQGAYGNLEGVRLELAPIGGEDDCPGCPFTPREVYLYNPTDAGFNDKSGTIGFSYCPGKGEGYQWRLIGISVYSSLPHAVSSVRTTINTSVAPRSPE
jgi:hypothetical protein